MRIHVVTAGFARRPRPKGRALARQTTFLRWDGALKRVDPLSCSRHVYTSDACREGEAGCALAKAASLPTNVQHSLPDSHSASARRIDWRSSSFSSQPRPRDLAAGDIHRHSPQTDPTRDRCNPILQLIIPKIKGAGLAPLIAGVHSESRRCGELGALALGCSRAAARIFNSSQ